VIVSDYVREDLNASGVYDGATTNRTLALTVNRRAFVVGQRRGITVATNGYLLRDTTVVEEPHAEADQRIIKATMRLAFASRLPAGSEAVALTYNVAA
jgi:hypothetical protein